jgi:aminoglycoside phosphotransferase (APT) family kinase protein
VPRLATLVLADPAGRVLGALPEAGIEVGWWPEAWPLVDLARERHSLDVTVLRLLDAPDVPVPAHGRVAYLAAAADEPAPGEPAPGVLRPLPPDDPLRMLAEEDHPRRAPWARPGGIEATLRRADAVLAAAGRRRTGPARQVKTWNLSSVLTLPTADGTVWCKSVPAPLAHEGRLLGTLAELVPGLAPLPLGIWAEPGGAATVLLGDAPGEPLWEAPTPLLERLAVRWVDAQAATASHLDELASAGVPDRRAEPLLAVVRDLAARPDVGADLSDAEAAGLDRLVDDLPARLAELAACGLPDTLVHGDLHPGNWVGDRERQVLIDWGDSVLGSPAFDAHTLLQRVPPESRPAVTAAWQGAWSRHVPDADPVRALELAEVVAALRGAAVYRGFLDAIERTERRYHDRDPAAMIRIALAAATPE